MKQRGFLMRQVLFACFILLWANAVRAESVAPVAAQQAPADGSPPPAAENEALPRPAHCLSSTGSRIAPRPGECLNLAGRSSERDEHEIRGADDAAAALQTP